MNIQEAFKILELDITASKTEIKDKHRNLIKKFHSDKEKGSHDKSSSINNARDIAIKYVDDNLNVSLIKHVFDVVSVNNTKNEKIAEYKAQSESLYNKISRKFGSKYKSYKSLAKTFGLISAIIALLSSKLIPLFPDASKDPNLTMPWTVIAIISGVSFLILNSLAERVQDSIDDLKDTLSDRGNYYDILNSILQLGEEQKNSFSRHEIEELCEKWFQSSLNEQSFKDFIDNAMYQMIQLTNNSLKSTVRHIGISDFSKYLISKGLEKNIIVEKENYGDGMVEIIYEINRKNKQT